MQTEIIALVDCNNFYVSCERVFNPALERKPVVVLSNNDGCVISRSEEAKQIGVPMGAPFFKWENFLRANGVHVFSSNYALYGDMSRRVMGVLTDLMGEKKIEVYSIDEAFLYLTGFDHSHDLAELGTRFRQTVKQWLGLPVSIGIASTRTLAKIANSIAKKSPKVDGVLNLYNSPYIDHALARTEVGKVWGIGRRLREFLVSNKITTALALRDTDDVWIKKHMAITGLRTVHELRGIPAVVLDDLSADRKHIICSRSFGKYVESLADLKEAVATYIIEGVEKLRRQSSIASMVSVFIRTSPYSEPESMYSESLSIALPLPSAYPPELIKHAHLLLEKMYRPGYRYQKAGIGLAGIIPAAEYMFTNHQQQHVMSVVDSINRSLGTKALSFAAAGIEKSWKMKQLKKSPAYTTRWSELPVVRTGFRKPANGSHAHGKPDEEE